MAKGQPRNPQRRNEDYTHKSPAICVVAYDLGGNPISDEIAAKVVNAVYEVTQKEKLAISFTRT